MSRPQGLEKSPNPRTVDSADHADQEGDSADRLEAHDHDRDTLLNQKADFHGFLPCAQGRVNVKIDYLVKKKLSKNPWGKVRSNMIY